MHGLACENEQGRVCLAHPQYVIHSLVDKKIYDCFNNWIKLEEIVVYRLQFK